LKQFLLLLYKENSNKMDSTWTVVEKKKKSQPAENKPRVAPPVIHEDDDTIVLKKKRNFHTKSGKQAEIKRGNYQTVLRKKTNVDQRHLHKLEQEQENFHIKKINRSTAQQIQQYRQKKGWTQKDLARAMNVTVDIVANHEKGSAQYDGQLVQKFKRVLEMK